MILAAGLTPAFQQILVFDGWQVGHVNRAQQAHLCASGKVLNVGLALHHLGGSNRTLALLGGISGSAIDREFTSLGIAHEWVWSQHPTRMCTTILDRHRGTTTELVENARPIGAEEIASFYDAYDKALPLVRMVVLSGSLPPGTPKTFYRDLIRKTPAPVILDASGSELSEALPSKPFCVKPNREELSRTVGRALQSDEDLLKAMYEVCALGAEWVVVSHGPDALWACSRECAYLYHPPKVSTLNPIGSGDCLAAAIAWTYVAGVSMPECIRFGIAAGAENASMLLPGRLDPNRVRSLAAAIDYEPHLP